MNTMNTITKSLIIFALIAFLMVLTTGCGAMTKIAQSGPGKAIYYGLNAVRNPVGTAIALSAGAAAGLSAAKVKETIDSAKKEEGDSGEKPEPVSESEGGSINR